MISFEKSVGAVVYRLTENNSREYLILQYRQGHWEFPRGHQEAGEKDEETARREIQEETGLADIKIVPGFSQTNRFFYMARENERKERRAAGRGILIFKKVNFFLAETKTTEIKLSEEQMDFRWLDFEQALKLVTYKSAQKILRKADEFLKKNENKL